MILLGFIFMCIMIKLFFRMIFGGLFGFGFYRRPHFGMWHYGRPDMPPPMMHHHMDFGMGGPMHHDFDHGFGGPRGFGRF